MHLFGLLKNTKVTTKHPPCGEAQPSNHASQHPLIWWVSFQFLEWSFLHAHLKGMHRNAEKVLPLGYTPPRPRHPENLSDN